MKSEDANNDIYHSREDARRVEKNAVPRRPADECAAPNPDIEEETGTRQEEAEREDFLPSCRRRHLPSLLKCFAPYGKRARASEFHKFIFIHSI